MKLTYNDLRPVLKKHPWLLPFFSIIITITSPILFPILFIIDIRSELKEAWYVYWSEVKYGFIIFYKHYFVKKEDKKK